MQERRTRKEQRAMDAIERDGSGGGDEQRSGEETGFDERASWRVLNCLDSVQGASRTEEGEHGEAIA
jgi:hypothetical protein